MSTINSYIHQSTIAKSGIKSIFDNTVFEFLPYHEYGKDKWKTEYKVINGFVSDSVVKDFVKTFEQYGLNTVTT